MYYDIEPDYRSLRSVLSGAYQDASMVQIEDVVQQTLGDVPIESIEDFLQVLGQVGQAALPVLLPAIGTVIGGPVGTAVGGVAGQAAAAGIGMAMQRQPQRQQARPPAPAAKTPPRHAGRPVTAAQATPRARATLTAPPPVATSVRANPAAAQLLTVLITPEFLQAIASMIFGAAGSESVRVRDKYVPVTAFAELASVLADQASIEHHAITGGYEGAVPAYLIGKNGESIADPLIPEERAAALFELLRPSEDEGGDDEQYDHEYWALAQFDDMMTGFQGYGE